MCSPFPASTHHPVDGKVQAVGVPPIRRAGGEVRGGRDANPELLGADNVAALPWPVQGDESSDLDPADEAVTWEQFEVDVPCCAVV